MNVLLIGDISLGSDPELFVHSKMLDTFIPSLDLVGGTKKNPKPMLKPGFAVQEDNVLLEFNIPPSKTKEEFVDNLSSGLEQLTAMLPFKDMSVVVKTSHKFKSDQLLDPRANEFGCDPDMNAWTGERNHAPEVPTDGLRTAGGHIHVGYKNVDKDVNRALVKAMDLNIGLPSILIDTDQDRRKLYGKAGAYRDKPYGVEYRTVSSFWLQSPDLQGWVWDQTQKSIEMVNAGFEVPEHELVVEAINTSNTKLAEELCKKYNVTNII